MQKQESLDNLSNKIEYEFHVKHELSEQTLSNINYLVQLQFTKCGQLVRDRQRADDLLAKLSLKSRKLFEILVNNMNDLTEEALNNISELIINDALRLFPNNPDIYFAYCIHNLHVDKQSFFEKYSLKTSTIKNQVHISFLTIMLYILAGVIIVCILYLCNTKVENKKKQSLTSLLSPRIRPRIPKSLPHV